MAKVSRYVHIRSCCETFLNYCGTSVQPESLGPERRELCATCNRFDVFLTCGICLKKFGEM